MPYNNKRDMYDSFCRLLDLKFDYVFEVLHDSNAFKVTDRTNVAKAACSAACTFDSSNLKPAKFAASETRMFRAAIVASLKSQAAEQRRIETH